MKAFSLKIYGRVQGVWFRASTKEQAQRLGVSGWVRNSADGAVEAFIQGSQRAVDELLEWCRQGPPGAHVERVDVEEAVVADEMKGFAIRY
ncbi:MAG TPA: acylphosphatase [Deltaproteobacteria bacterium]|jgi:acylphosphatase|nr:acylphosphatase [Deltaproteobacteria bacterium]HQI01543.1 acylphosphatase [Deltaproteobacteria bacterium]HQJ09738.1 acylphosphatase [Deltaproteobacteria bacterium]